jgi:2-polyprenyl-6-hydroxyphenyl methylase/3-demethylubiquinone-9 3-methyltransferase
MNAAETRGDLAAKLRAPAAAAVACKVCGAASTPFGTTDFNRTCEEVRGLRLPASGTPIAYRRCVACGLVFTDAFDDWSHDDFRAHIYNDAYPQVDPDSVGARPVNNAARFARTFAVARAELEVLDYGGGEGRFAAEMRAAGFACETYDPIYPAAGGRPDHRFGLVTTFETLEHLPDPAAGVADIAALTADDGAVLMTTLVQPADFDRLGMAWWYIGPRNGHVTLFSRQALAILWARVGFKLASFDDNVHMAFRGEPPAFVRAALAGPGQPAS